MIHKTDNHYVAEVFCAHTQRLLFQSRAELRPQRAIRAAMEWVRTAEEGLRSHA